jgi:hypothetical protein
MLIDRFRQQTARDAVHGFAEEAAIGRNAETAEQAAAHAFRQHAGYHARQAQSDGRKRLERPNQPAQAQHLGSRAFDAVHDRRRAARRQESKQLFEPGHARDERRVRIAMHERGMELPKRAVPRRALRQLRPERIQVR